MFTKHGQHGHCHILSHKTHDDHFFMLYNNWHGTWTVLTVLFFTTFKGKALFVPLLYKTVKHYLGQMLLTLTRATSTSQLSCWLVYRFMALFNLHFTSLLVLLADFFFAKKNLNCIFYHLHETVLTRYMVMNILELS